MSRASPDPAAAPGDSTVNNRWTRYRTVSPTVWVSLVAALIVVAVGDKAKVIHNAVDLSRFAKGNTRGGLRGTLLPSNAFVFGSSGRILPRKGYPHMIRAAAIMSEKMSDEERSRVRFVVAGDTPSDMPGDHLEECRTLVKSLNLESVFFLPGFCEDVREHLEDTDEPSQAASDGHGHDPLPAGIDNVKVLERIHPDKDVDGFHPYNVGRLCQRDQLFGRRETEVLPRLHRYLGTSFHATCWSTRGSRGRPSARERAVDAETPRANTLPQISTKEPTMR